MAPNIFGLHRALRMDTFSSFGSFRDVKPSLACFLKLCSCAMFACGCAMFVCGYAVLARDQTRFLHSTSSCVFCGMMGFRMVAPCFSNWAMFLQMPRVFIDAPLFFVFSERPQTTEMWKFGGTTSTMCPTCGSKTLSFLHWKCLGLDLSCSLEGCRMLRKLPAESGFFYAKQSRSALTNCDKPMQNLDQSKKNRWRVQCSQRQHLHQTRPQTTEMWKFGGTTSSMCQTCGSKSNVKFLHVKAKPIWLNCFCSCFFHLLSLSCCRPCTVQNTHGGCQKRFSPGFVHPAMFNPRHSASMPNAQCPAFIHWPDKSVSVTTTRPVNVIRFIYCQLRLWSI